MLAIHTQMIALFIIIDINIKVYSALLQNTTKTQFVE